MDHQLDVRVARSRPLAAAADCVAVAAACTIETGAAELDRLRAADHRNLRHADEQTVLALAAVRRAAANLPSPLVGEGPGVRGPLDGWGVIVAPRWQGRIAAAETVARFRALGVRGVGPQVIPNLCLHAPAATVSIGISARGPVYGVGGGAGHVADGLLAALAAQLGRNTPGTWLALTEWHGDENNGCGRAVALALVPVGTEGGRWQLALRFDNPPPLPLWEKGPGGEGNRFPSPPRTPSPTRGEGGGNSSSLAGLIDFLTRPTGWRWDSPLEGGGELSLMAEGDR